MARLGLGPALERQLPAPSHRVHPSRLRETLLLTGVWLTTACNLGHSAPSLRADDEPSTPLDDRAPEASDGAVAPRDAAIGPDAGDGSLGSADAPCIEGAYRCVRSGATEREKCEGGQWKAASSCGQGRVCEFANATTTACVTPASDCDGGSCQTCIEQTITCQYVEGAEDVAVACSGGRPRPSNCRGETSHCVTELGCKACSQASHCTAQPPECYAYACSDEFACELVPTAERSPCTEGVCNAAHACVECVDSADCGEPDECRKLTCEGGQCVESLASPRSSCSGTEGGLCDAAGNCVACLEANDCPLGEVPACYRPSCSETGLCEPQPLESGSECGANASDVCDGAGACVECVNETHCDEEDVCHDSECISPYIDVGWFEGSSEAEATAFAGFVYLRRLEPLAYPATLRSFGAIASSTTTTAVDIGLYDDNGAGTWPEGQALTVQRLEGVLDTYRTVPASSHPLLEVGKYYWLGFRVSADVELQLSSTPSLTYDTGRRIQTGDFGTPFYAASQDDAVGGDSIEPFTVFAVVQYTQ